MWGTGRTNAGLEGRRDGKERRWEQQDNVKNISRSPMAAEIHGRENIITCPSSLKNTCLGFQEAARP
jgi:hypothetical protein